MDRSLSYLGVKSDDSLPTSLELTDVTTLDSTGIDTLMDTEPSNIAPQFRDADAKTSSEGDGTSAADEETGLLAAAGTDEGDHSENNGNELSDAFKQVDVATPPPPRSPH